MRKWLVILLGVLIASFAGCAPRNVSSMEGAIGGLTGAAIGAGIGSVFADEFGHRTENIVLNSAIGAGAGLLTGAAINQLNEARALRRARVVRQAKMIGENQQEIDTLREEIHDSTKWGRAETKSWNERYLGHGPNRPFQGATPY